MKPTELSPAIAASIDPSKSDRFTEHCLVADRECTVLGICAENPSPQDEHGRKIIMKGVHEKTFLITTKTEMQEEESLRRSAVRRFFIGAGIMVAVTAFGTTGEGGSEGRPRPLSPWARSLHSE